MKDKGGEGQGRTKGNRTPAPSRFKSASSFNCDGSCAAGTHGSHVWLLSPQMRCWWMLDESDLGSEPSIQSTTHPAKPSLSYDPLNFSTAFLLRSKLSRFVGVKSPGVRRPGSVVMVFPLHPLWAWLYASGFMLGLLHGFSSNVSTQWSPAKKTLPNRSVGMRKPHKSKYHQHSCHPCVCKLKRNNNPLLALQIWANMFFFSN